MNSFAQERLGNVTQDWRNASEPRMWMNKERRIHPRGDCPGSRGVPSKPSARSAGAAGKWRVEEPRWRDRRRSPAHGRSPPQVGHRRAPPEPAPKSRWLPGSPAVPWAGCDVHSRKAWTHGDAAMNHPARWNDSTCARNADGRVRFGSPSGNVPRRPTLRHPNRPTRTTPPARRSSRAAARRPSGRSRSIGALQRWGYSWQQKAHSTQPQFIPGVRIGMCSYAARPSSRQG